MTPHDYRIVFEDNPIGAGILEELIKMFARPSVSDGGIDAILKTYERGGQRKVLEYIAAQINRANGVEDPNEQPHEV